MEGGIDQFSTYMREVKLSSNNTVMAYQRDLKRFIKYLNSQEICSIDKVNETCLNSYILTMERDGLAAATVSRSIASVKSYLFYLIKKGDIKYDPTERIRTPQIDRKVPSILSLEKIKLLLNMPDITTKKGRRDKAMIELLYATGIRVSELITLKITDINMKSCYILCSSSGKERVISFGSTSKDSLIAYLNEIQNKTNNEEGLNFLFTNVSGQPMSRQGLWKIIKQYAKLANIEEITPQILRNSFLANSNHNDIFIKRQAQ